MNKSHFTFEQLCIRNVKGYSFDLGTMFMPSNPNSFDDVVFKLISKIDTSLLLLNTHNVEIENFTIISLPISSHDVTDTNTDARTGRKPKNQTAKNSVLNLTTLQNAWDYLSGENWHGLQSLALLNMESMPMNGSRKYSLYQYITCIMDVIRANYMFQKFKPSFYHETMEIFDDDDIKNATQAVFGLLWRSAPPLKERKIPNIQIQKRKSFPFSEETSQLKRTVSSRIPKAQILKENNQISDDDVGGNEEEEEEEQQMEVDDEISFKNPVPDFEERLMTRQENVLSTSQRRTGRKSRAETLLTPSPAHAASVTASATVPEPENMNDITLGFELGANTASASKGPKKSMGRKSLSSEWPEDERHDILSFYDNLNPDASEQKRIALTCKYVSLYMDKELPSKLLYQWVQKKGRENLRTAATFTVPEGEQQKQVALKVFRDLNDSSSETARINYTLKYLDVQYSLNITSKQLYDWLSEKPTAKKGGRRR
ncbi:UNVERIFIED_CONTAM: hypothetical protein RMT77_002864 [Armadillidium vulgare]